MSLVVDANVAVHWTIESPQSTLAENLLRSGTSLIAPDLIIAEVTNALLFSARGRPELWPRARDGIEFLPRWFAQIMPTAPLRNRALALAMKLDHPAYDCFYLALAETEQVQMVTTDEHFIRKVQAAGQHRGKLVHLAELQV